MACMSQEGYVTQLVGCSRSHGDKPDNTGICEQASCQDERCCVLFGGVTSSACGPLCSAIYWEGPGWEIIGVRVSGVREI